LKVAGDDDGIFYFRVVKMPEHAVARELVAGPLFHAVGDLGSAGLVDADDHDLLRDDMPRGGGALEAVKNQSRCRSPISVLLGP
jgi:hypothetical protein